MSERYAVFKVYYDTYENVARDGDKPPEQVSKPMPYEQALARLDEFWGCG